MAFTFQDLTQEVLRRGTRDQSGTQYTVAAANLVNTSLWSVARYARWKQLRRELTFNTVAPYQDTTKLANVINGSTSVTLPNANLYTNDVAIGRYITLPGSAKYYRIAQVNSATTLTLDQAFDGATGNNLTSYGILPQEYYTLPAQIGHEAFFWHRAYGYPLMLTYVPTQDFYMSGVLDVLVNVPLGYRMWGCDASLEQPKQPGIMTATSPVSTDNGIAISWFGTVNGYPDYESLSLVSTGTGPATVIGSKNFSRIDRVTINSVNKGLIQLTSDSGNTIVGAIPVGGYTTGLNYTKVQLYPLPYIAFPINCLYYKEPMKLINSGDIHELGEQFDEAIILLATAKMKAEQNLLQDSQNFMAMFKDEMNTLRRTNVDKIDWYPKLQAPKGNYWNAWTGGLRYAQVGGQGQFGPQSAV